MDKIYKELYKYKDEKYKEFIVKLIPNKKENEFIGIRTNNIRQLAKQMIKSNNYTLFLEELPHKYFEENQLHAFIISEIKDYDECINYLNKFLSYIDNWATCDQLVPKVFKKNQEKLLNDINRWIVSKDTYTVRFSIGMLMKYYLDENFKREYLDLVASVNSDEYYINMMRAWFFSIALVKQYTETIKYIEHNKLDTWTHNKTIQKAIESNCISNEIKEYLRSLKK